MDRVVYFTQMVFKVFLASILVSIPLSLFFFGTTKTKELITTPVISIRNPTPIPPTIKPLTLETVFSRDHKWVTDLPDYKKRVLIATGDVLLGRNINATTIKLNNFNWPFEKVADVLKSADITYINLESPIVNGCKVSLGTMVFCGDPRNVAGLVFAGVDVANIANNHRSNYGQKGIDDTIVYLNNSGILTAGDQGSVYKEVRGLKFAFIGYDEVFNSKALSPESKEKITRDIAEAKANADIAIVQFHWGNEYTTEITEIQKGLAHFAIDSGADLVIGNHPHWIQPVEIYKDKFIAYSHGNFVFDQEWSQKTKEGVVGKYTFYDKKLVDVEFLPVEIVNYGQPYFLEGEHKETILKEMQLGSMK